MLTVVIDTFRAGTTACHILAREPLAYFFVTDSRTARDLAERHARPLLVGKPEIGADLVYDIANSPARVADVEVAGRTVIHRTNGGASAVMRAGANDDVLLAGFVNVGAVARTLHGREARLIPAGHEGATPTLEDDLTVACIQARVRGESFDLAPHIEALRAGPGRYFFTDDQLQYPRDDFDLCLAIDAFDFAIRAERVGAYARLSRV